MTYSKENPMVSIGIPTYNRALLLERAIQSALNQTYENIEVIVSDNASSDQTESLCRKYGDMDSRVRYYRQNENIGPTGNFSFVLQAAAGEYFMWLGDDDWLDSDYVSECVGILISEPEFSLVSGTPAYYRHGRKEREGKVFSVLQERWWKRVVSYYWRVADNGIFYGIMRRNQIGKVPVVNAMGGDWLMMASVISMGKAIMIPNVVVNRELGGATASYKDIAASQGISKIHAIFPWLSITANALSDLLYRNETYTRFPIHERIAVAIGVSVVMTIRWLRRFRAGIVRRAVSLFQS